MESIREKVKLADDRTKIALFTPEEHKMETQDMIFQDSGMMNIQQEKICCVKE